MKKWTENRETCQEEWRHLQYARKKKKSFRSKQINKGMKEDFSIKKKIFELMIGWWLELPSGLFANFKVECIFWIRENDDDGKGPFYKFINSMHFFLFWIIFNFFGGDAFILRFWFILFIHNSLFFLLFYSSLVNAKFLLFPKACLIHTHTHTHTLLYHITNTNFFWNSNRN